MVTNGLFVPKHFFILIDETSTIDLGPHWIIVQLENSEKVLSIKQPKYSELYIVLVGLVDKSNENQSSSAVASDANVVIRTFFPSQGSYIEDPVTGSANCSTAQWLLGSKKIQAPYIASQGTCLGRNGRVFIEQDENGTVWVGGHVVSHIEGLVKI
jgi:PhzF family phenazine biosynthesis protein